LTAVLVTGGSGAIGAATIRALHEAGATVVFSYRSNPAAAGSLVRELGDRVTAVPTDLSDAAEVEELWRTALAAVGGRIDVLVNNAGNFVATPIDDREMWRSGWASTLGLHLQSAADLSRLAILHFRANGGGAVINVSSRAAHRGSDKDHLAYAAAKAGLLGLTRGIAGAYADEGVLAYAVAPGWVETGFAPLAPGRGCTDFPLGEPTTAADVAEVIAFLATCRTRHITGATIDITGADYIR
jgi:NAD(P)-dependent dehydrogenase (short-subunit alcohol dehydrogenase family)